MVALVTCKNKEDPIKNEGASVVTTLSIDFSDVSDGILPKFKLIQAFIVGLVIFQTLKGSLLISPWSDLGEFRTHSRCYGCPRYLKE